MRTRRSSLATSSSTPSSTPLRPIFHWSNTRWVYCSIASGCVVGTIKICSCAPLRCCKASACCSSCWICPASRVPVTSTTGERSDGMAANSCASNDAGSSNNAIIHTTRKTIRRIANSYVMRAARRSTLGFAKPSPCVTVPLTERGSVRSEATGSRDDCEDWHRPLTQPLPPTAERLALASNVLWFGPQIRADVPLGMRCLDACLCVLRQRVLRLLAATAQARTAADYCAGCGAGCCCGVCCGACCVPKSTCGAREICASFSTLKLGLGWYPKILAVITCGNERM